MYNYATNKPYQFMYVDALKNEVWKWGATQPELMWTKYDDNGGYNPPFNRELTEEEKDKSLEHDVE